MRDFITSGDRTQEFNWMAAALLFLSRAGFFPRKLSASRRGLERKKVVRAKFKVESLKFTAGVKVKLGEDGKPLKDEKGYDVYEPAQKVTIEMNPVYGNGDPHHENTKFWQASPSGKLELNCVNEAASKQFEVGKEYYVDFTPAA